MVKGEYQVLGKVNVPEENMKDLIWVDRKSGEVRTMPFGNNKLSDEEKAKRAKEKAVRSEAFAARVIANAQKAKARAEARIKRLK